MNKEAIKAKKTIIAAVFNKFAKKISNLHKMLEQGFIEEALILACCYISALADLRYGTKDNRDNFIKIIFDYSDFKNLFSKISWINFYKKGKDPLGKSKTGKPISRYEDIKSSLLKIYDKKSDHYQEMYKSGVINYLKQQLSNLDLQNLEVNLDKFSYAAVLYEEYRSAGVHKGSMAHSWDAETGKPLFDRNEKGEDIYYDGNILCFSKEIILATLKNVHHNLEDKCISVTKWPHEL